MKKISSGSTMFYKKVFPLVWFGFLAFFVVTAVTGGAVRDGQWMFLVMPCFMAVFGFFLMKKLVWDPVDEVHTLRLVRPGRFGADVSFSPSSKISFNPFAKNPVVEDLIVRVDQARLKRAV